jgi:glutamate carboxypeptidase
MQEFQSWLDQHQESMADELEQLCNLNSGSHSNDGLTQIADWLVDYFAPLKVPVQTIELQSYEAVDDLGLRRTYKTGNALRWDIGCLPSESSKRLLLSIHYDTVYGPESPFQKCVRYSSRDANGNIENRMRGPGVIDAKGGLVVMRWAAMAAQRFLDLSRTSLTIITTPDEEIGSPASIRLWQEIAGQFDFAMLFEPTLPDGSLVSNRKGTGTFVIVVRGKAAHAGRNFLDGRNAVVHASKLAVAIDSLNGRRPDVTLNVGRIRGGDAVNVVPDMAVIRVNVRVTDKGDSQWVESQVQQIAQEFNVPENGYTVEMHGGLLSAPKPIDRETSRWMQVVEQAGAMVDQSIRWNASGGASDGNKLASLGLSNIDTFGPEGDLLHSDQEWVRLASLAKKAILAVAVINQVNNESKTTVR